MNAFISDLPSSEKMQTYCHVSPDRWLLPQTLGLAIGLTLSNAALSGLLLCIDGSLLLPSGLAPLRANVESWSSWMQHTVLDASIVAVIFATFAVALKTYLQARFGAPVHDVYLQVELPQAYVFQLYLCYLREHAIDDVMLVDDANGRLIALLSTGRLSSTFAEVTTRATDSAATLIVIRGVSVVRGPACIFSSFFNDFGVAWKEADKMKYVLRPYGGKPIFPFPAADSIQRALPGLLVVD